PGNDAVDLSLDGPELRDISPIRALPSARCIYIHSRNVSDLGPVRGMNLRSLILNTGVADLSPLKDMTSLRHLDLSSSGNVVDLAPLKGLALEDLGLAGTQVSDLTPLKDMKSLKVLNCDGCRVTDLSPLQGLSLEYVAIHHTKVSDLSPLKGMQ